MKKKNLLQEEKFLIGIDLGSEVATVSFIEHHSMKAVIYDMSGGYGKSQIPMMMQYISEENDWFIGENTQLDEQLNQSIFLDDLMVRLRDGDLVQFSEKEYVIDDLLAIFIGKIIDSFSLLNPHAVVQGLVIAIPDELFIEKGIRIEANWKQSLGIPLKILSATQAVIYMLYENGVNFNEKRYLVNCEDCALSAYECHQESGQIVIKEFMWDPSISMRKLQSEVKSLIQNLYAEQLKKPLLSLEEERQMSLLYRQYLPLVFQKYAQGKSIKLYFNFAYPPFQSSIGVKKLEEIIQPIQDQIRNQISKLVIKGQKDLIVWGQGLKFGFVRECFPEDAVVNEYKPTEAAAIGTVLCALRIMKEQPLLRFEIEENIEENEYFIRIQGNEQAGIVGIELLENMADTIIIIDFEENKNARLELVHKRMHSEEKIIKDLLIQQDQEQMPVRVSVLFDSEDIKNAQITVLSL